MLTGDNAHPLSFAQEQVWFIDQLRQGSSIEYLLPAALRLRGVLDLAALSAALTTVAERHEVLRTRYDTVDGQVVQVVDEPAPVVPEVLDLGGAAAAGAEHIDEIRAADLRTPIDLRKQAPWRITLVRLSSTDAVLLITVHHIAFDGLSWSVLARELSALYGSFAAGAPPPLDQPTLQYRDAASRQRQRYTADQRRAHLDHWCARLAGLAPLELPTDNRRPARWNADGDCVDFTVPADLARRLRRIGRTVGATPFMVHLAAYHLLLGRYSGQSDVAVGVSVSTRDRAERELIGIFLNTVVLRGELSDDPCFAELLRRTRRETIDALAHHEVPFERVVAQLDPERDPSRNPVFQASLAWYDTRAQPFHLPGLDVTMCTPIWVSSAFDLSLHLAQRTDGSVRGQLVYPTQLFTRGRIERMAANHLELLTNITDWPDLPASRLTLVATPERRQLRAWSRTRTATPPALLHDMILTQARTTPDALAVVSGPQQLTYAELASRATTLAAYLRAHGVGVETPVGVALHRGTDLVTALLAVLSAGGSYVPLPPEHPTERLAHIAADARVALVLTHASLRQHLPPDIPQVALDEQWTTIAGYQPTPRPVVDQDNAAYIIYTSGSTGRPKGVIVTHAGIRNRVQWSVDHYRLSHTDRVLQKTTIGFDASVWELITPLVVGGTLVIAPPEAHHDPTVMARAIVDHSVTVLQLVPSVLRLLLQEASLAECTSLRLVCCAGEPLPTALCQRLTGSVDVDVYNTYGPTECAIDATAWRYQSNEQTATVPIGAPLPNIEASVVDDADQLVPIGVPGLLCLSGVGVARGYAGRPDLTADRFTPHPYADRPGERWYSTGDVARWREDGVLEFLGRVDHQVKINGVRVEPAEVEASLCAHPSVAAAAVVARGTPATGLSLVAYLVPADGALPPIGHLHDHLARHVPGSMIPAAIVGLDALPTTPNGKLDRAALSAFDGPGPAGPPSDDYLAPRDPTEQSVAEAMAGVLGVERVGLRDDFFALGGHSLLAIRLVLRLRRAFAIELTVDELFTTRTVEGLAARIARDPSSRGSPPIHPAPRHRRLPLSFGQQRMWFLDQLDPHSPEYLIPLALRLRGPLDIDALRHAMDDLARRHEVLRTRYTDDDGEPVQVVDPPAPVRFDLFEVPEAKARELIDMASSRPFDLEREHPLRVTVARMAPDDHFVALTLHHIAFDAWSNDTLLRDLDTAYRDRVQGRRPPRRPPPTQYADFAVWQREQQSSQLMTSQLDYWRDQLAGITPVELPTDRPRPAMRDPRGDTVAVAVPEAVGRAVAEISDRHRATPFMLLLAAFQVMIARYTGRTDIAVGTPMTGRTRQETEDLVGFFTNTLVMRSDLSNNPTFTDFLEQVRRTTLDAFANQDVPFEYLVDALQPDRDLSRNPLFQVMFEVQHRDLLPTTLGPTTIEPIRAGTPVAKFDLTLTMQQHPDGRLRCVFEYATSLFDQTTVERMARHYLQLLETITAAPSSALAQLDLLDCHERRLLLAQWPDPSAGRLHRVDPPEEHHLCVPHLFERQVAQTPQALAVLSGGRRISYAELNARANTLAHRLGAMGVGPEVVVGSCLERSVEAVVTLLAVLKAGGVYAPFDPRHPAERLQFMLTDANVQALVTNEEFADRFRAGHYPVATVGADEECAVGTANLPIPAGPSNLAYLIYTSGSTSRPKGVMIEHRSYAHHCRVIADAYAIGPQDRVVLLSALTFDVAMDQIAATLIAGAAIVVSDPVFWSPAELPARLAEHRVTIMEITPAYYRETLSYGHDQLGHLKLTNVGSDIVTVADVRGWMATGPTGRFVCSYGPTEATVTCFLYPVADGLDLQQATAALPIGRPVTGSRAYILDADLRPVPVGVPGELCLGGVRLARGYHSRPALTAERFVPDPLGSQPGARLYRTGDLARHRPDGNVEFLGRIDHQVKIRGLRIELGEIEAALGRHPEIRDAAVVTVDRPQSGPRIAAYLVPRNAPGPGIEALRAHLRDLLPEYMIPSLWTTLEVLPMTASGKVDRTALPDPAPTQPGSGHAKLPPRGPTQQVIAGIWSEVLGVDAVGADDDFFALGGHSLLATRVLAQLRRAFAVDLPLRRLFEATTVADLADTVTHTIESEIAQLSDAEVATHLARETTAHDTLRPVTTPPGTQPGNQPHQPAGSQTATKRSSDV